VSERLIAFLNEVAAYPLEHLPSHIDAEA